MNGEAPREKGPELGGSPSEFSSEEMGGRVCCSGAGVREGDREVDDGDRPEKSGKGGVPGISYWWDGEEFPENPNG